MIDPPHNGGIIVFWVVGPSVLVTLVAFILLKFLKCGQRGVPNKLEKSIHLKHSNRRTKYTSHSVKKSSAPSPDLERQIPDPQATAGSVPCRDLGNPILPSALEAVWRPARLSPLEWDSSTQRGPSPRQC